MTPPLIWGGIFSIYGMSQTLKYDPINMIISMHIYINYKLLHLAPQDDSEFLTFLCFE